MDTSTVNCQNCSKPNYTTAKKCWHCRVDLNVEKILSEQIAKQFNCPRCHSVNTSSFEMIYSSGTSQGRFSSVSYGGDVGMISTGGVSKSQSLLAQQVSPPKLESGGCLNAVIALAILFGGSIFGCLFGHLIFNQAHESTRTLAGILIGLAIGISGVIAFGSDMAKKDKAKREVWEPEYRKWQNSWMCLKCGNRWVLNEK